MLVEQNLPIKRCAIYTRKSTTHRLEHHVNSLVTQRKISSAYIKTQQYKGWVELPQHFDDGGHSGSGLERPALARLMQDIEAGMVDAVVIYKIDRLTRSLFGFVRLIEMFDRQSINCQSAMLAPSTIRSFWGALKRRILLTAAAGFQRFRAQLEDQPNCARTRKYTQTKASKPARRYPRGSSDHTRQLHAASRAAGLATPLATI